MSTRKSVKKSNARQQRALASGVTLAAAAALAEHAPSLQSASQSTPAQDVEGLQPIAPEQASLVDTSSQLTPHLDPEASLDEAQGLLGDTPVISAEVLWTGESVDDLGQGTPLPLNTQEAAQDDSSVAAVDSTPAPATASAPSSSAAAPTTSEPAAAQAPSGGFAFGGLEGLDLFALGALAVAVGRPEGGGSSEVKDTTAPQASIRLDSTSLKAGSSTTVTITFTEVVSGFALSDLTAENGTLSDLVQSSANPLVWTAKFTPTANVEDVTNVIKLANSYTDGAGNAGTAASSDSYAVDTKAPTATVAMADTVLTAGETTTVTITFSEAVSNFALEDLTAENGTLSDLAQSTSNPLVWTAKFTPAANLEDTTNVVTLASSFTDSAGNGGSGASGANYTVGTKVASGAVADGYISGATVFRDLDGDSLLDAGEPFTITDEKGQFTALGGFGGTIVAFGGIDISTGLAFEGLLKAPTGSTVINPLTTLVSAVLGDTGSATTAEIAARVAEAEVKVATLLGLDDSVGPLTQFDPIAAVTAGGAGAEAALKAQLAALQVANLLAVLKASAEASGLVSGSAQASELISQALDNFLSSATTTSLDLTNPAVVTQIFGALVDAAQSTASAASLITFEAAVSQVAQTLATVNEVIASVDTKSGVEGLKLAVAAQLVILDEQTGAIATIEAQLSATLELVKTSGITEVTESLKDSISIVENFTEEKLGGLVEEQLSNVKDVTGVTPTDTTSPTAVITLSDTALVAGETTSVTITFSEAVSGFALADLVAQNGTLSGLTQSSANPLVWSATFTPSSNIEDTTNVITLANTFTDLSLIHI